MVAVTVLALGLTACGSSGGSGEGAEGASSSAASGSSSGSACGSGNMAPGSSKTVHLTSGGRDRSYVVTVPKDYSADTPTPVVMAFHGRGRDSEQMKTLTGFSDKPAIAVYPQGLTGSKGTSWQGASYASDADDVKFTGEVLDKVESDLCVDTDRVYAAGMSNGGGFASLLACRMSDRIAAFASVSGAYYGGTRAGCNTAGAVPIMEFHGTDDPTMKYDGGDGKGGEYISVPEYIDEWVARNQCSHEPEVDQPVDGVEHYSFKNDCKNGSEVQQYRIDGGGHTWPGAPEGMGTGRDTPNLHATDLIWEFFQNHRLSQHH
ncbi:alpha/beta hydrolase family esterase [Kocuria massiliensis]|uniref:alpha/beta hydrolase family esterase n=1 Tax=Kocuria massiliensis TaxID=1926282 RepID=UPI001301C58D|nr:PHB depolymerase family esterase [Kocuria massiliensis]